ncbi:class I adenylate-forming enzyme family protein [Amycolatopsis pigmentata]|uniref:Class I adenylate-forming enzyme family protein n=1 Tax=Amycolatopsis pigmentata TaxID=450801 RepID=A0ABW5FNS6_9PSEU
MPTIPGSLRASAGRLPGAPALTFGGVRYTYRELDQEVDRMANALLRSGLRRGDRLALMAANSDLFVIVFYAALRAGAIFVPVNPASAPPELAYILTDSGATTLVFDAELSDIVDVARSGDSGGVRFFALGQVAGYDDLRHLAADAPASPPLIVVEEDDDSLILYTSGTTGRPKGALFDHHRSVWVGVVVAAASGMRSAERFLHVAPLYHAGELCIMLITGTMLAAHHVVHSGFDAREVLDTMEAEGISMFFGVPTMYQAFLSDPGLRARDLSRWRVGMFGSAPMPGAVVEQLLAVLPGVELIQFMGQTEGGPGGVYSTPEQVRARPDACARQALPFTEARVVDAADRDVQPGEIGELVLRGETVMKGYWHQPGETERTLRDGWLHTGDLVKVDHDGYLTVVDRLKDMIISGGRNVYSVEVENALAAHPHVLDCAVIGRPHPYFGESIVAVVVPRDGTTITLDGIKAHCRKLVASYKVPHDLLLRQAIPRNPSGKVLKHVLRDGMRPGTAPKSL